MASVVITIETDGAAFHSDGFDDIAMGTELARIFRVMATNCEFLLRHDALKKGALMPPRDTNGDPCGKVEVID